MLQYVRLCSVNQILANGESGVNKKLRNLLLIITASLMVALSMIIGSGKAKEVNKSEVLPARANAAGKEKSTRVISEASTELGTFGDILYGEENIEDITASETDAENMKTMEETDSDNLEMTIDLKEESTEEIIAESETDRIVSSMSLEDKVAQLFIITPDALANDTGVTMAGDVTKEAINKTPVGGIIYMGDNIQTPDQVKKMLSNTNKYSMERTGLPMIMGVDEEGGTVSRVAGNSAFGVQDVGNMSDIGETGDSENARQAGITMGTYLSDLGFNLDFAPVADVLTNPDNSIVKYRSFGSDVSTVSDMSLAISEGLRSKGIEVTYKHFPGHGATAGDTHIGAAFTNKTLDELRENELVPFQKAIDNGAKFIMVSHISTPNITGQDTPASLSDILINKVLRQEMGYNGIVVTDAMEMGAVSSKFSSDEAAVQTILAGTDMILMPEDFQTAYNGVVEAVKSGRISEDRLNESVRRIVDVKLGMNTTTSGQQVTRAD